MEGEAKARAQAAEAVAEYVLAHFLNRIGPAMRLNGCRSNAHELGALLDKYKEAVGNPSRQVEIRR